MLELPTHTLGALESTDPAALVFLWRTVSFEIADGYMTHRKLDLEILRILFAKHKALVHIRCELIWKVELIDPGQGTDAIAPVDTVLLCSILPELVVLPKIDTGVRSVPS